MKKEYQMDGTGGMKETTGLTAPGVDILNTRKRPRSALRLFEPDPALVYSIDVVERLTQVPRRKILVYCRHRLVSPVADPEFDGYCFSSDAIRALRWIGYLHGTQGVNLAGIKLILDLADEVQRLRVTSTAPQPRTRSSRPK